MTLKTSYLSCRFQLINLLQYWLPISAHSNSRIQITRETSHFYNDFDL
nr:MAG TPA: hypothetical protein [Bacteriophage sp.]